MSEQHLKTTLYVMGAVLIAAIGASIYLNSEVQHHKSLLEEQAKTVQVLKASQKKTAIQNEEILSYMNDYHGDDTGRTDEHARMKILLEGHDEKLHNIVKTINELH